MRFLHDQKNYYADLDKHYLPQLITFSLICINLEIIEKLNHRKAGNKYQLFESAFYDLKIFVQTHT